VELKILRNRAQKWTVEALENIRETAPMTMLGIDSDNGSEFINDHLLRWCNSNHINFTRGRPHRTEDTCYVEQKNGAVVRRFVGYLRYDTQKELELLEKLYQKARLLVNFYYPSMKLVSKTRAGSKVRKRYDVPRAPWRRLLESAHLSEETKNILRLQKARLNPAELKRQIIRIQERLWTIAKAKSKATALMGHRTATRAANPARLRRPA